MKRELEELGIKNNWYAKRRHEKKRHEEVERVGRYQVVKEHREWCLYNSKGEVIESSTNKKYIMRLADGLSVK